MTPHDRSLHVDLTAARYLDAIERDDFEAMDRLWQVAADDPEVYAAFCEVHAGLIEELDAADAGRTVDALAAAVVAHLPSGEVLRPAAGPVTVGAVADELLRRPPDRLPAAAHALNEKLRASQDPLPADLGLSKLVVWAEGRYGAAPREYWKAFLAAATRLDLRAAAGVEYGLAARATPPKPGGPT